ncbi:MAG: hypothetical protein OEY29_16055 [Gammaproteobacteria bacterium]|nr:hypothetical protein [Gammaproteobacteria bacterium]
MKRIIYTIPFLYDAESNLVATDVCAVLTPNYKQRNQLVVSDSAIGDNGEERSEAIYRDETDDEVLQRIMEKDIPADAINITICEESDLPYSGYRPETKTRTEAMRNSWVNPPDNTSPPIIDMAKARQAKLDLEWRPRRLKILADLDIEYQRADEAGNAAKKNLIALEKQKLRDMPVVAASTAETIADPIELDNYDPVVELIANMPVELFQ